MPLCRCGCGQSVRFRGTKPNVYVHGHNPTSASARGRFGEDHPNWSVTPSYRVAHTRVEKTFGKASTYDCVQIDCDRQAHDWANLTGHFEDPYDYVPLCRGCHIRIDRGFLELTYRDFSPTLVESSSV